MAKDPNYKLALAAEAAGRFDDMAEYMRARVESNPKLSREERDMFSAAYKNSLTERRQAVRTVMYIEHDLAANGDSARQALAQGYRTKVNSELVQICEKVTQLITNPLIPACGDDVEASTFYYKMLGDYYRYLAEFAGDERKNEIIPSAEQAYDAGTQWAQHLPVTHAVRLGLALNYSVFQHEVCCNTLKAIETAMAAQTSAAPHVTADMEEAAVTLHLLQDNLTLWNQAAHG